MMIMIICEDIGFKVSYLVKVDGFEGEGILMILVVLGVLVIVDYILVFDDLWG